MPHIRIVTAGASFLLFLAVTLGSAAAQTSTAGSPGKPLPLLQFVHQKSKSKLRPHAKMAGKFARKTLVERRIAKRTPAKARIAKTRLAKAHFAKRHKALVQAPQKPAPAATAALPENIWPAADAAAPGDTATPGDAATLAPQPPAASVSTEPVVDTDPNEILAGGHTVQVASPNEVNPIDLAAGDPQDATKAPNAAPPGAPGDPIAPKPVVHAMIAKAAAPSPDPVGSASWIGHVLAALGGAIAAGAVAWFMIRPAPEKSYE